MERIWSTDISAHVGERVHIAGWLHHQRKLSQVAFVLVRDARGVCQVVVGDAATRVELEALALETVLSVDGIATLAEQAPGGVELHDPKFTVIATAADECPIELRRPRLKEQLPTQLDHGAITLRHPRRRAVSEIAAASVAGFRATLDGLGFVEIQTPKIVASATESGANVFEIDYFGQPAFLAQSPQFYKQIMVGVHERVYEVGPVFRAEPHDTSRHLAEYVSLDAEIGFADDHTSVMAVVTEVLVGMLESIRERARPALRLLDTELPDLGDIPVVDFTDAQAMIERATGEPVVGEPDLAPAHERWLGGWALHDHRSEFVFVTGFPMSKRPFYTHPDPTRPMFSNSFDLLFRGVELITGGQRLHHYDACVAALAARGESVEPYQWYLEAFQYGMPPHGGFALGLERWLARLVGAGNVRETTLFPRDRNRLSP